MQAELARARRQIGDLAMVLAELAAEGAWSEVLEKFEALRKVFEAASYSPAASGSCGTSSSAIASSSAASSSPRAAQARIRGNAITSAAGEDTCGEREKFTAAKGEDS